MPQFRKKPVEVEARGPFTEQNGEGLAEWCRGTYYKANPYPRNNFEDMPTHVLIPTKEGVMMASLGDWIIRGVAGEFYPCKPHIFEATHEPC